MLTPSSFYSSVKIVLKPVFLVFLSSSARQLMGLCRVRSSLLKSCYGSISFKKVESKNVNIGKDSKVFKKLKVIIEASKML